jgi:hypothetical protein
MRYWKSQNVIVVVVSTVSKSDANSKSLGMRNKARLCPSKGKNSCWRNLRQEKDFRIEFCPPKEIYRKKTNPQPFPAAGFLFAHLGPTYST